MANMHQMHCWFQSFFTSSHRTVTLRTFAGRIMYLTLDPVNVHYILKDKFQNYPKGERVHSVLHDFMGDGICNSDGKIWRKHRKIASFEFSNRKLKQMSLTTFRRDALPSSSSSSHLCDFSSFSRFARPLHEDDNGFLV
ncbi:hypothetical protein KP509_01G048800 [Ceratopteris richardii]|uniref:Cytochrome P450 n=1 Tax=Ceratopteris richardii TaxID=49495 RepID=A0A8T2VKE4_CERRI|nr:hypothetical protein KP509_01G048800 [Ceratopteris richardii]